MSQWRCRGGKTVTGEADEVEPVDSIDAWSQDCLDTLEG